ncbi:MAG: hypothetical protein BMS9Abin01_1096 [Gammaproteobacteria bacterium]|nr:MAG: hypothetical protein BMS9Abin01_1096 [Gammaproteobacteria bacterium]
MDERLKRRLVGAAVLVLAAVVFVPMLLDQGGGPAQQPPRMVPSPPPMVPTQPPRMVPAQPPEDADARVVPLKRTAPVAAPPAAEPAPAKKKPAARTSTVPAPAEPSGFAVQLGSFSKADNARGLRDKLVARGYKAFVKSSGSVSRVYVGPQRNRAEAEKMLKKLLADTKLKGIVVNFSG